MIGIKLRLFNGVIPRVNLTGIQAIYWDAEEPVYTNRPTGRSNLVATDSEGDAYIDLSGVTELGVGGYGFLTLYQPNISDPRKSLAFMGRVQLSEISAGAYMTSRFIAADVPQYETDALMNFYNATDGPNWTNNTGWGTDPKVANWYGVIVANGHVTWLGLALNGKTLSGPGLQYLSDLRALTNLRLNSTGVTGDIATLSGLEGLANLNLASTGVSGDIAALSGLEGLIYLHLGATGVVGDIATLSGIEGLIRLQLYNTGVTGDIATLSGLEGLANLQLYSTEVDVNTVPVFSSNSGNIEISGSNPAPDWGTAGSPSQVAININALLNKLWTVTVTGEVPQWVKDL